ncbi:MAG: hypothetical protein KF774_16095 [Planctomyces sp.]|nr:hypothetical protein [Planctomyces sp.]
MRIASPNTLFARICLTAAIGLAAVIPARAASKIEAVEGKRYQLTREHGPWMIMVATFHTSAADGQTVEGKSPENAAADLVLELRKRNLPAYVHKITAGSEMVRTVDRTGRDDVRKNLRMVTSWGVIAGNYPSLDDPLAQKTLAYVKQLKPRCLDQESGVVWYAKAGEGPLRNAFLTTNPLLSEEEIKARQGIDPLLIRLNSDDNYSLLENKGQYTLQVAMFTGRKVLANTLASQRTSIGVEDGQASPLDLAAQEARDLTLALREFRKIEAYVWHDHFQSIVTVGSFSGPDDPKLREAYELFRAKEKFVQKSGQIEEVPETFYPPSRTGNGVQMWAFMPQPVVMPVPKMRARVASAAGKTPFIKSPARAR